MRISRARSAARAITLLNPQFVAAQSQTTIKAGIQHISTFHVWACSITIILCMYTTGEMDHIAGMSAA